MFFCPTTKLVEQQAGRLEAWFPDIATESLIGGDEEEKPKIEVLLTQNTKRGKPMCQVRNHVPCVKKHLEHPREKIAKMACSNKPNHLRSIFKPY